MKKNLIFFAVIGIIVASAAACSKENSDPSTEVKTAMVPCCIQASTGEVTKTHISGIEGGKANIAWNEGDNISVFSTNVSGGNNQFTISNIDGGSAKFDGEVEDGTTSLVAVYPYSSGLSYNSGTISGAVIPTTQSATAGSFINGASIALAKGTKTVGDPSVSGLSFSNLCAVVGFTIPSEITFANQVTVTAKSGAKIAGNVSINASTTAITSADAASVIVNGTFTGGNTYYVCIAPGTYTNGFNFAISTSGGNSYNRSTTKTATLEAGKLYTLGKLSVELSANNFSTSVALSDKVSSSTLNGTDAKFTMSMQNIPSEFSSLFTFKSYSVTFKDASGNTYRTLSGTAMPSGAVMTAASGKPYIPKGTYSYDVTVNYNNGSADKSLRFSVSGFSRTASPSGFALNASLSGYTSYSCYKGTDGQGASTTNANNCDNATIYNVGASYASGLSAEVYSQCKSLVGINSTLDSSAASGNVGSQSWASHTIGATWSFDGASGTCTATKTVYVTGLPYRISSFTSTGTTSDPKANDNNGKGWVAKSWHNSVESSSLRCGNPYGWATSGEAAWRSDFSFCVPENINVTMSCPGVQIHTYSIWIFGTRYYYTTFSAQIAGVQIFSQQGSTNKETTLTYNLSGNGTLTTSNSQLFFKSSYEAIGPWVLVKQVNLTYR